MISYLDKNDKKFIKLYTFLATFVKDLPSYDDFLDKEIYPLYDKINDKVKIEDVTSGNFKMDTVITKYPDIDEYEKIIEESSKKLEKRLIQISKYIFKNIDDINKLLQLISIPSNLRWDEKIVSNFYLKNVFDLLKEDWLNSFSNNLDKMFELPDRFFKENKIDLDVIEWVKSKFLSVF